MSSGVHPYSKDVLEAVKKLFPVQTIAADDDEIGGIRPLLVGEMLKMLAGKVFMG